MNESPRKCRKLKPDAIPSLHINSIAQPSSCTKPIIDRSSDNVTKYIQPDLPITDGKELTNHSETACSVQTQTIQIETRCIETQTKQICSNTVTILASEYKDLITIRNKNQVLNEKLQQIFTPGQIRILTCSDKRRIRWSAQDIAAAITFRSISPKGYRYMRNVVGIPLPAFSTICKWASKFEIEEGVLENVITLMQFKAKDFTETQRIVALSFDEIYISNKVEIDRKNEQKVGPHNTCQCVMARGLCGKWKQPIFYKFDKNMTTDILMDLIRILYSSNLIVASITCDMGPGNQGLLRDLNIGVEKDQKTWFKHPSDHNLKVHVFIDVPHLLKLARNHFIDFGFQYENKLLVKDTIEKVLSLSQHDLKLAHKLTPNHLNLQGSQRQKVRPAAQLFSNTTALAVEWCGQKGFLPDENWFQLSQVLKTFNEWFDVFNARLKFEKHKKAYGLNLSLQNEAIQKMNDLIKNTKTGKKKSNKLPFQRGILISNKSLPNLLADLQERLGSNFEYILTSRLNQDILENFFSYIRGMGATNDHPTGLSFKHRLKRYILGKHSADVFKYTSNTCDDPTISCLVTPLEDREDDSIITKVLDRYLKSNNDDTESEDNNLISSIENDLSTYKPTVDEEQLLKDIEMLMDIAEESEDAVDFNHDLSSYIPTDEENLLLDNIETQIAAEEIRDQGLKYISGYVAFRFLRKYPHLGDETRKIDPGSVACDWIFFVSRGKLIYPCKELIKVADIMEREFNKYHGESLHDEKFIFTNLTRIVHDATKDLYPQIHYEVVLCLVRTRTYLRVRELNKTIICNQLKKKQSKKIQKVSNMSIYSK